jgi:hypothetical protein
MEIEILAFGSFNIARILSTEIIINDHQDALDLMANCQYHGAHKIMVKAEHIVPHFFDLKTGIAGEILQKFSTYRCQLAIIGDYSKYTSKSLRDFIYESNKFGRINFVENEEEAMKSLSKKID